LQRIAAIIIPLFLITTLVGGTAFAVNHNFWGVFNSDQGAGNAFLGDLGKTVNLVQSFQGYTMTVSWVYSDSIRAIMGYNIAGPAGHHFESFALDNQRTTLQTGDGQQLPFMDGDSPALWAGSAQQIVYFDASALNVAGKTLSLHLDVPTITAEDNVHNAPPYTSIVVPGPYRFNFTAPYYAGQTIQVQQTLSDSGRSATLEKVVVTPSAAQAYLKLGFPIVAQDDLFIGSLIAPHGAGNLGSSGGVAMREDDDPATHTARITSVQVSSQSPGRWSLEVQLYHSQPNSSSSGRGLVFDVTFSFVVK